MKKTYILLALITLVAFLLRVIQLGELPAILNRDEAALAYNTYLLAQTGQDEWQRSWPLALQSFGDYKLIGYPLALIPFLKLFGLTDFAVRLPSALAGTALVPLIFILAKKIKLKTQLALFASLVLAVSPVFIWYSRLAFEANLALTYLIAVLVVMLDFQKKAKTWHGWTLAGLIILAVITYNTPLLLLPNLMVFAWLLFATAQKNKLILVELIFGSTLILGLFLLLPLASQKSGITIFSDETTWYQWTVYRASLTGVWQALLGNRYIYFLGIIFQNFLKSFSPQFLVTLGGAHPWHSLPSWGHLYWSTYFLGLLGILRMLMQIITRRTKALTVKFEIAWLWLLFTALLPSIITVDAPHATRSLLFFVLFLLTAMFGLAWLLSRWQHKAIWVILLIIVGLEGALHNYQLFGQYSPEQHDFQPGFGTTLAQVEAEHPTESVAIVDPAGYHYILLAWYLKITPETYFDTIIRQDPDPIGFRYGQQLSHYHFIAKPTDRASTEPILVQWSEQNLTWSVEKDL